MAERVMAAAMAVMMCDSLIVVAFIDCLICKYTKSPHNIARA